MAIFRSTPHPSQDPASSLRLPATKRISASQRLSTILESGGSNRGSMNHHQNNPPTVPLRSILRPSRPAPAVHHPAFRSHENLTGPPAYGKHDPSIADSEDLTAPVEGEKLAQLRRAGPPRRSRGGWKRLAVILAIALIVIGLAVGLGVGLTVGRRNANNSSSDSNGSSSGSGGGSNGGSTTQPFPLGQYTFVTALRSRQTSCTSAASSWLCPPGTLYSTSNTSSMVSLNWVIANTSSAYATDGSASGPANLTISSTGNPLSGFVFSNQTLSYDNSRYTFNFSLPKSVVPNPAITSNGQQSICFYNSTRLTGSIYLSKSRTYPDISLQNSTSLGGYQQWPYAVEIVQESPGGQTVPDCYETINGVISSPIINVLVPQSENSQCLCDYSNF